MQPIRPQRVCLILWSTNPELKYERSRFNFHPADPDCRNCSNLAHNRIANYICFNIPPSLRFTKQRLCWGKSLWLCLTTEPRGPTWERFYDDTASPRLSLSIHCVKRPQRSRPSVGRLRAATQRETKLIRDTRHLAAAASWLMLFKPKHLCCQLLPVNFVTPASVVCTLSPSPSLLLGISTVAAVCFVFIHTLFLLILYDFF